MDLIKVQTHALLVAQVRRAARHRRDGTSHGHELPVGLDPGAGDEHRLRQAVKQTLSAAERQAAALGSPLWQAGQALRTLLTKPKAHPHDY